MTAGHSEPASRHVPLDSYEGVLIKSGLGMSLFLAWVTAGIALGVLISEHEVEVSQGFREAPGFFIPVLLIALASATLPFVASRYRRVWNLFPDRIEIHEQPVVSVLGWSRKAQVPLADIAEALFEENPGNPDTFEIRTKSGRRFRIAASKRHQVRTTVIDNERFGAFLQSIERAIANAGLPRPPGRMRLNMFDTLGGQIFLGGMVALCGAMALIAAGLAIGRLSFEALGVAASTGLAGATGWSMLQEKWRQRLERKVERARSVGA